MDPEGIATQLPRRVALANDHGEINILLYQFFKSCVLMYPSAVVCQVITISQLCLVNAQTAQSFEI